MEPNQPSPAPRKVKFLPKAKAPTTRKKPLHPKRESVRVDDDDDEEDEETNEALLRKVNDHLTGRRRSQADKKSAVQVVFSQGVVSDGVAKEGSGDSAANTSQDILSSPPVTSTDIVIEDSQNATGSLPKQKKRAYREPWDYANSDYPITLPLRRPYSGDPEVLDEEEFGENGAVPDYDESSISAASDLGLMEKDIGVKMLFLQLPADLPFGHHRSAHAASKEASGLFKLPGHAASTALHFKDRASGNAASSQGKGKEILGTTSAVSGSAKGKEIVDNSVSSMRTNFSKESRGSELPAGRMGKLLVYKSGAVKLKLGDILYDVSPGSDCTFAQDVVAINTSDGDCCALGELTNRGVLTPDIDSLLDPVISI